MGFLIFDKMYYININDFYLYYINPNFYKNINDKKYYLFIGLNLRLESPILNIKLRKNMLKDSVIYCTLGSIFNDNLNAVNLGNSSSVLLKFFQGKLKFCKFFIKKIKEDILVSDIMYFIGNNILNRIDCGNILDLIVKYSKYLKNVLIKKYILGLDLNIIYLNLTNILYEELNLYKNVHNVRYIFKSDLIYLLDGDFFDIKDNQFLVFQGHHIINVNLSIDLVLPSITFLEKSSSFLNIEGNLLKTNFILHPPIFSRND